jgi:hypothetical protein
MSFGLYSQPENTKATKAFELVRKGQRDQAVKVLTAAGYADPERQVQLIEGFLAQFTKKPNSFRRQKRTKWQPTSQL